jgi:hypothetical protein
MEILTLEDGTDTVPRTVGIKLQNIPAVRNLNYISVKG